MITINRKNPTEGEVTSSLSNAENGGLHFDGVNGSVTATPPYLGSKFSFEIIASSSDWNASCYFIDFHTSGRFIFGSNGSEIAVFDQTSWKKFGVQILDDNNVHHLVVTIDGTAAVLYDNGNQVGTQTISTGHNIDSCSALSIGPGGTGTPLTLSRTRFYNRALSGSEIKEKFENQNLEFSEMWASQTSLVDAAASVFTSGTYGWVKYGNNGLTNTSNQLVITYSDHANGAYNYLKDSTDLTTNLTVGKKYKVKIDAKYAGGSAGAYLQVYDGANSISTSVLTTTLTTYYIEFTAQHATNVFVRLNGLGSSNVVTLDNFYVYTCGAVSSYELQSANPSQSLMVQDSSGAADGTCSASGVSQIQPLTQISAVAARIGTSAATPADGTLLTRKLQVGGAGEETHPQLQIVPGTSSGDSMIQFRNTANAGTVAQIKAKQTSGTIDGLVMGTAEAEHLSISSAGRVSIGGSADPYSLSADTTNTLTIQATGTNKAGALDIAATGTGWVGVNLGNETIRRGFIGSLNGSDMAFYTNPTNAGTAVTERLRISSAGNVAIGSSAASEKLHLMADGSVGTRIERASSDGNSGVLDFYKTRGTLASKSVVGTADTVGALRAFGYDGSNYIQGGEIAFVTNGTPGTNDMPGRLQFSTTADGAASPTVRMTISSAGDVSVGAGNSKEATIQSTNSGRVEGNPAYSFRGDLDTGMFNPNTDNTLAFSTGGTERMRIASNGEIYMGSSSQGVSIHGNTTGEGVITGINAAKDTYKKLTLNASEFDFKISGTSKATISSAGLATFANGITVAGGVTSFGGSSNAGNELTIANGAVTITSSVHTIDTESDAAVDDLDNINGGVDGTILILCTAANSRDVTFKDGTGNLELAGDFTASIRSDIITLTKHGSVWREVSRSDNG